MFASFKPTWTIEALYSLEIQDLRAQHIKGILVDLDNTLVAWNNPDGTPELRKWIKEMRAFDIPVVVVSNNKASRIDRVVTNLGLTFVSRALKPFTRGLRQAQKELKIPVENLVMVGDQLMTDIKAANGIKMRSILVKPVVESDAWNTKFNRSLEKIVKRHLFPDGITWEGKLK